MTSNNISKRSNCFLPLYCYINVTFKHRWDLRKSQAGLDLACIQNKQLHHQWHPVWNVHKMFPGFQTLLEYTYRIVLWCIPQILFDLCNLNQQRKICMVPSCFTKLSTWLTRSANSHTLRLQDSHIGPQKGLNVHTYNVHVQGITTDTHASIKDNLQSWCAISTLP